MAAEIPNKRIVLLGSTGYAGQVLHALIMHYPCMSVATPPTRDPTDEVIQDCASADVVALALPEEASIAWVAALRTTNTKIIDLSGAHRRDPTAHYGLPELFGAPHGNLVANPGCYPTATLIALRPLLELGLIEPAPISVLGQSGTSGAGKALRADLHFSELHGNFFPYNVGTHRHVPEIELHLGAEISFVTEVLPIVRGLLVTAFVTPTGTPADLLRGLQSFYEAHPYVTVVPEAGPAVGVRHVVGTHQALVAVGPQMRSRTVPVFCAIDNLMRGAASQALHNINLWLGLPAHAGLPTPLSVAPQGVPGMNRMLP